MSDPRTLIDIQEALEYARLHAEQVGQLERDLENKLISDWNKGDLIPRAEHEAAVEEARKSKRLVPTIENVQCGLAADVLVDTFLDDRFKYREYVRPHKDGQNYRVTVERVADLAPDVSTKAARTIAEQYAAEGRTHKMTWPIEVGGKTYFVCIAPHDGTGYSPDPVPDDAEPVGYSNRYEDGFSGVYHSMDEAEEETEWAGGAIETAVPLYRRPAPPQGTAAALLESEARDDHA